MSGRIITSAEQLLDLPLGTPFRSRYRANGVVAEVDHMNAQAVIEDEGPLRVIEDGWRE